MQLAPAGNDRFRIYMRGRLRLDLLTPKQAQMKRLGDYSVDVWKQRVLAGLNTQDQPAKPLQVAYARRKIRFAGRSVRNLYGLSRSDHMLDNFKVRTVGSDSVRAGFTTVLARTKAQANEAIEPFLKFSPDNQRKIRAFGESVLLLERLPNLAVQIDKA